MEDDGKKSNRTLIIIIAVFTVVIGPVLVHFLIQYFNTEKPNLIYSITKPIATKLLGDIDSIQELKVKNIGDSEAKSIKISFKQNIDHVDIKKNSLSDQTSILRENSSTEIFYSSLPPQAEFTIVLQSSLPVANPNRIKIRHEKGIAVEAFSQTRGASFFDYFLTVSIVMLIYFPASLYNLYLKHTSSYDGFTFLKKNKPFFYLNIFWNDLIENAFKSIKRKFYSNNAMEIINSEAFTFLDSPNKSKYDNEIHKKLVLITSEEIFNSIQTGLSAFRSGSFDRVLAYIQIPRPFYFPEIKWQELQDSLANALTFSACKELTLTFKRDSYERYFIRPPGISNVNWDRHISEICDTLFTKFIAETVRYDCPIATIEKLGFHLLSDTQQSTLRCISYKYQLFLDAYGTNSPNIYDYYKKEKPDWMVNDDFTRLQTISLNILHANTIKEEFSSVISLLTQFIKFNLIQDRPNYKYLQDTVDNILNLLSNILDLQRSIKDQSNQLSKDATEIELNKDLLQNRLNIINDVLEGRGDSFLVIEEKHKLFTEKSCTNLMSIINNLDSKELTNRSSKIT